MVSKRTSINLVLASDLSQRMRSALDSGAAAALLMLLTALLASAADMYLARSQISEAMVLFSTIKVDVVVYRAEHGNWPDSNDALANDAISDQRSIGKYVDYFELADGGAATALFGGDLTAERLGGRRLTFRPLVSENDIGAPVPWVCGARRFPGELTSGAADETDIAAPDLPSICRNF